MNITFYGATDCVTGSNTVLEINNKKILIDAGLYQGRRDNAYIKNSSLDYDPSEIDIILLTHAHIDHSGNIPNLVKNGFTGTIYCTHSTYDLCEILLEDSVNIQIKDLPIIKRIFNSKGINKNITPIYNNDDVIKSLSLFKTVDYEQEFIIMPGVIIKFIDAGHILGSSSLIIHTNIDNIDKSIGFTGDIGDSNSVLMPNPSKMEEVDYLITESTYGSKNVYINEDRYDIIKKAIQDIYITGGKLVIPAFSVGRMQTIVYMIHKLYDNTSLPNIPVYIDSKLGLKATNVFKNYLYELNEDIHRSYLSNNKDPFEFDDCYYIKTIEESKRIQMRNGPSIIISASGMGEGGSIRGHIKSIIEDDKSILLFVGHASENTLNRRIMESDGQIKISKKRYDIKCDIRNINSLSSHADKKMLINNILSCIEKSKNVYLIHGDYKSMLSLKKSLITKGFKNVIIPKYGQKYGI